MFLELKSITFLTEGYIETTQIRNALAKTPRHHKRPAIFLQEKSSNHLTRRDEFLAVSISISFLTLSIFKSTSVLT